MELLKAEIIAQAIIEKLLPHCEEGRLHIAGSIRRKKADVGDIEILCIGKKIPFGQPALFEEVETELSYTLAQEFVNTVNNLGSVLQGSPTGNAMKILLPEGIKLDLFIPNEYDYFRMLAIRTGSQWYAHNIIAVGWRKQGWVGTENGLRKIHQCFQVNRDTDTKKKWKCQWTHPTLPPVWKSEEEFFEWINVPYINPEKRNQ